MLMISVDYMRRNHKEFFSRPLLGPFLVSGCAATFAWWVVWPLELAKSQVSISNQNPPLPSEQLEFTSALTLKINLGE